MKLKKLTILIFTLLISFNSYGWFFGLFDKYDSYGECMYQYYFDKNFVESVCPRCNDWQKDARLEREKDKKADRRCFKYLKPWE